MKKTFKNMLLTSLLFGVGASALNTVHASSNDDFEIEIDLDEAELEAYQPTISVEVPRASVAEDAYVPTADHEVVVEDEEDHEVVVEDEEHEVVLHEEEGDVVLEEANTPVTTSVNEEAYQPTADHEVVVEEAYEKPAVLPEEPVYYGYNYDDYYTPYSEHEVDYAGTPTEGKDPEATAEVEAPQEETKEEYVKPTELPEEPAYYGYNYDDYYTPYSEHEVDYAGTPTEGKDPEATVEVEAPQEETKEEYVKPTELPEEPVHYGYNYDDYYTSYNDFEVEYPGNPVEGVDPEPATEEEAQPAPVADTYVKPAF